MLPRLALIALFVCGWYRAAKADARVAVEAAEEMGFLSASHARITGSYGRRLLANRTFVELRLGAGVGTFEPLLVFDQRVGGGIVIGGGRTIEGLLGIRLGTSYVRGEMNGAPFRRATLVGELAPVFNVAVRPGWRVRFAPILPTLFWRGTVAASIGLELGVERAL